VSSAGQMRRHTDQSKSCVRDEGVGLDGRSPAGSEIEGNGELAG
jgi:hypothetical protein